MAKKRKHIYSATEARKNFYKLLEQASKPGQEIIITRQGKEPVSFMSTEELDEWRETIEVMSDPQLVAAIEAAKKSNDFIPWEEVKKELDLDNN